MGSKAIGLSDSTDLEVVNTRRQPSFLSDAKAKDVHVVVVSGTYKIWPYDLYQEWRPMIESLTEAFGKRETCREHYLILTVTG